MNGWDYLRETLCAMTMVVLWVMIVVIVLLSDPAAAPFYQTTDGRTP